MTLVHFRYVGPLRASGMTDYRDGKHVLPFFCMSDENPFRVFATARIGNPAENRLRKQGL